jgi:hypothetical protein
MDALQDERAMLKRIPTMRTIRVVFIKNPLWLLSWISAFVGLVGGGCGKPEPSTTTVPPGMYPIPL